MAKVVTVLHKWYITRYLFLEVANGVLISVSEEVEDFMLYVIFLQVVH